MNDDELLTLIDLLSTTGYKTIYKRDNKWKKSNSTIGKLFRKHKTSRFIVMFYETMATKKYMILKTGEHFEVTF